MEKRLRAAEDAKETNAPSLLEELFYELESDGRWRVSFSDLCGLAQRVPDLHLPVVYQLHSCDFCAFAKSHLTGLNDCVKNKRAANRIGVRRASGFAGICHLGVTDLIEPLLLRGQVMGLFLLGSVVPVATEMTARERLVRYLHRRQMDPAPHLAAWEKLPRVSQNEVETVQKRLHLVARIAARLAEAAGFPNGQESPGKSGAIWESGRRVPPILAKALAFVQTRHQDNIQLKDPATYLNVRPDYLGSLFRKHTTGTFGDHLASIRIQRACRLLDAGRHSAGEVALMVGFRDQAHFGKVFKRETGMTPGAYARNRNA